MDNKTYINANKQSVFDLIKKRTDQQNPEEGFSILFAGEDVKTISDLSSHNFRALSETEVTSTDADFGSIVASVGLIGSDSILCYLSGEQDGKPVLITHTSKAIEYVDKELIDSIIEESSKILQGRFGLTLPEEHAVTIKNNYEQTLPLNYYGRDHQRNFFSVPFFVQISDDVTQALTENAKIPLQFKKIEDFIREVQSGDIITDHWSMCMTIMLNDKMQQQTQH